MDRNIIERAVLATKRYRTDKTHEFTVSWRLVAMAWGMMLLWQLDFLVGLAGRP